MAIPTIPFVLGILALAYLSSFILFAILRIVTGISIQRIGLTSLRRIAYTSKEGIKVEIRGLGLHVHRPTFAQPTWISVVIEEPRVTIDLSSIRSSKTNAHHQSDVTVNGYADAKVDNETNDESRDLKRDGRGDKKRRTWANLIRVKDQIKRLHSSLSWIRLVDVVAQRGTVILNNIGEFHVGSFVVSVDTRPSTVDRSRLFQHTKSATEDHKPAEWTIAARSILFTPVSQGAIEILDHCTLNIHGFLHHDVEGLRDATISLKLGRLSIPYDDLIETANLAKQARRNSLEDSSAQDEIPPNPVSAPLAQDAREKILQGSSEAKQFIKSTIQGIREISFAVGFVGISKRVDFVRPKGVPIYLNASMKEVGMEMYRLDQTTPSHAMYFPYTDIAHQALLSAISVSVGIDDGHAHPERLAYVPMMTATVRTTLPAKLLQFSLQKDYADHNANMLFATFVITSPSIDLDPRHLPVVLATIQNRPRSQSGSLRRRGQYIISQLLPKTSIKLSIHEPVFRVSLPPVGTRKQSEFEFDLLISAVSSISLDIDSSHLNDDPKQYSILSSFRFASHRLYYQTTSRQTHDLVLTESLEAKAQVSSATEVQTLIDVNVNNMSVYMTRPEISNGVRQIVHQLRPGARPTKLPKPQKAVSANPLRVLPKWLTRVDFQATGFHVEVAAVDSRLSDESRGFTVHMDSWSFEYKIRKDDPEPKPVPQRRGVSHSLGQEDAPYFVLPPQPRKKTHMSADVTDGRRIAIHIRGLESFIIETSKDTEDQAWLSLPRSEVSLSTNNDGHGPILHVNCFSKKCDMRYSLFRHYAVGVATTMLLNTFTHPSVSDSGLGSSATPHPENSSSVQQSSLDSHMSDLVTVDLKLTFVCVKAQMPADPGLMFHMEQLEACRHRWTNPFARSRSAHLFALSPSVKRAWTRIVSLKAPRIDIRDVFRKQGVISTSDRSIDFASDAIRIGVPHQLIVHQIFDNIINCTKTVKQLHFRFSTGTEEYILEKEPEDPKKVPKVSVRTHILLFELEDGAFEWKLGTIYRTGLLEQKQRIAREEAFRLKCRRLQKDAMRRNQSFSTPGAPSELSSRGRSELRQDWTFGQRTESPLPLSRQASPSRPNREFNAMRYDPDAVGGMTSATKTSIREARERLDVHNAQSWKKRIDGMLEHQISSVQDLRSLLWGAFECTADEVRNNETILQMPRRPALMSIMMSDLHLVIDKPSFPIVELPNYLHRVGKGLPEDTLFSLLIPMNVRIDMGETRMSLRDYPLPVLHIPGLRPGQSPRLPSWSFKTDFVIAEEFSDNQSTRDLPIKVIPADKMGDKEASGGFAVDVKRTVSPVKMYSDIQIEVNTARDTRFTWGTSYQPAIQDMMQVIESFTKPQLDPSEKVGFWDKIRLTFHSRVSVAWTGGGDVQLMLKGSRDPYTVTGQGAGFVMVWRNNVRWNIWKEDDPQKFMTVDGGDFVLAVPDFSRYARNYMANHRPVASTSSIEGNREGQTFKKVIMKLSGKVRWQAGLVFEQNLVGGLRSSNFEPHYKIRLKNPIYINESESKTYDAFRGFRSSHIHLSIAVSAPTDRDWKSHKPAPSANYNAVHLTPRFFTHFFAWWAMFSGIMSLPIRQGSLFPNIEKSGKKFGRHIATIKYSLLLSPLYISHIYKHKEPEEYAEDAVSSTGLKLHLNSFMLDLHQRKEEFASEVKGLTNTMKTTGMRINQTLLDLIGADLRAVSAGFSTASADMVRDATPEKLLNYHEMPRMADISKFTIPDGNYDWVDADDFVEIDWILPSNDPPETQILPLAYSPRFTYRRQTDHQNSISGDVSRRSPFGYEDTHNCIVPTQRDSRQVQVALIQDRLNLLDEMIADHTRIIGEQELRVVQDVNDEVSLRDKLKELRNYYDVLHRKQRYLQSMLRDLQVHTKRHHLADGHRSAGASTTSRERSHTDASEAGNELGNEPHVWGPTIAEHVSDFNNRFIVHNAQIKWNNSLRNILLRYVHQVSQRRGFVYYTTRRAVKFILDIIDEQKRAKTNASPSKNSTPGTPISPFSDDDELSVQDRIEQILKDGQNFVNADDSEDADATKKVKGEVDQADKDVSQDFLTMNAYHLRLVAPQIQLQSEKNPKAVVLLTSRGIRLKVFQIMDKDRASDDVSGLVQTRFAAEMDNMQFFVTSKQLLAPEFTHIYSGNYYGAVAGSSWPPWAPMEAMFDFDVTSYGFSRIVQRTSAALRYDKYNTLRLKYNDSVSAQSSSNQSKEESAENRMDHVWIDFPQLRAICDSGQYYALYVIVLDLLLWNEPLEKTRSERLEKIMLASDFSDLRGAPEMVIMLQERIRQLEEIKTHFHVNEKYLDRQGWEDRIGMEKDLTNCEDELFFIMKAITTSQRRPDDRADAQQVSGVLRYYVAATEIVWHLIKEAHQPLAEFQLGHATFERTDNSDGSNQCVVEIDRIYGVNLLSSAMYPEIIGAYLEHSGSKSDHSGIKMLRVNWQQMEAIAGINVVDHFEINLFPLKIQLEFETGKQLFEYIFPDMISGEDGSSPFILKTVVLEEEEDADAEHDAEHARRSSLARIAKAPGTSTGAGSLEARLMPTFKLPDSGRPQTSPTTKTKREGLGIKDAEKPKLGLMPQAANSGTSLVPSQRGLKTKLSNDSLRAGAQSRTSSSLEVPSDHPKRGKFGLARGHRSRSVDSRRPHKRGTASSADDLTQMLNRASNYMTLAYFKVPSVVLCLSYKGKGDRNFEDIHNLVFRMPTLEFRNKTWSNLDLALAMKREVIRALISHTGAIVRNKLSHHSKPGKAQLNRLRDLVSSSVVLSSADVSHDQSPASPASSIHGGHTVTEMSSPIGSAGISRTESFASNLSDLGIDGVRQEAARQEAAIMTAADRVGANDTDMIRGDVVKRTLSKLPSITGRRSTGVSHTAMSENGEETTPKRGTLVKKLLHSLDRD